MPRSLHPASEIDAQVSGDEAEDSEAAANEETVAPADTALKNDAEPGRRAGDNGPHETMGERGSLVGYLHRLWPSIDAQRDDNWGRDDHEDEASRHPHGVVDLSLGRLGHGSSAQLAGDTCRLSLPFCCGK